MLNRICMANFIACFALVVLMLNMNSFANGQENNKDPMVTFNSWYDSKNIYYEVSGGEDTVYKVSISGCRSIRVTENAEDLQGSDDNNSVMIRCRSKGGGAVKIKIFEGTLLVHESDICFTCTAENDDPEEKDCCGGKSGYGGTVNLECEHKCGQSVPSITQWGMAILVLVIMVSAIIIRHRRQQASLD